MTNERFDYSDQEPEQLFPHLHYGGDEWYYTSDRKYKIQIDPEAAKRMETGVVEYPHGTFSCEGDRVKTTKLVELGIEALGTDLSPLDFMFKLQDIKFSSEPLREAWEAHLSGSPSVNVQNVLYLYTKLR